MEDSRLRGVVRAAARGDRDAAGALFDEYHPRVYRYALAKVGAIDTAEDIAAETFARILRGLRRFRWQGGGFEAWLFRIASNQITDHYRRTGRETVQSDVTERLTAVADPTAVDNVAVDRATARGIGSLLDDLPAEQREVLLLRFAAGLGPSEIAQVTGKKANAVRQLQFRALTALRQRMADEGSREATG